jgi:peptide/nickel transport system permease protein
MTPIARIGLAIVVILVVVAAAAPRMAPQDPNAQHLAEHLRGPSPGHPLGQDQAGRDILSRIVYGARVSVLVGFTTVAVSLFIGVCLGSLAGYFGRLVDDVVMRAIDVLQAFPGILLAIALTAVLGPSLRNIVLALCVLGWIGYARIVRGQFLRLRETEFVSAARALGAGDLRIILRHILPNIWAPVIVQATFGVAGAILAEASLSFLGLGTQGIPSWGGMLDEGVDFLNQAPHVAIFPGLALMITILGLNFLGDGLRDRLDPRMRAFGTPG